MSDKLYLWQFLRLQAIASGAVAISIRLDSGELCELCVEQKPLRRP